MAVRELLLDSLDDLREDDFKTFKWHLMNKVMDGYKKIAKARLENASRTDTVDRMTENYGDETAVNVSIDILEKMGMRSIAEDLKKKYAA